MTTDHAPRLLESLERRRRQLRMNYSQLASRSGVSVPTLTRTLTGKNANASFSSIVAIAQALGVDIDFREIPAQHYLEQAAELKAARLVGMVQGTSGLEGQAVSDAQLESMKRQTVHELMAAYGSKLWG